MRHAVRSALLLASLSLALLWNASVRVSTQSTPQYGVTDLGTLGGSSSVALAIDDGTLTSIYGYSTTASGARHAFSAYGLSVQRDLGTLGGQNSEARGSTNNGLAVGRAQIANGDYHAFLDRGLDP